MNDLLTAFGDCIESRITRRGFGYKLAVGILFVAIIGIFVRDVVQMIGGEE